ncbi:filamentous hemagglutinin N-terminal domain-containing protein [Pantanalinema rosaneae CENA516]|uniref:two-partner secretion domain-containing protein n=1 Tax=Pantanalinema rosaneae TaxID=1620701 RepID=UPI003D6EBCAB
MTVFTGINLYPMLPGHAQMIRDNSLGAENSEVILNANLGGQPVDLINGGSRRGANLFHSFQEFNVGNLQRVYFANPVGVENILTRVTGNNPSNILGTLGVLGAANLFLINPRGILFGANATLDLRGSFVASTASSIKLADGTEFSATEPAGVPLLTISVPIGLQFNGGEGDIVVQAGQPPTPNHPFIEVDDAGQLPGTAQVVNSSTSEVPFDAIAGTLNTVSDVDLYQLFLPEGQPFTASTVGRTHINTQLFLFDRNGLGLLANNDSVGFQSTLPLYQPFIPATSGTYYLGISSYAINPYSSQGAIFNSADNLVNPGATLPLSQWNGIAGPTIRPNSGAYTITLNSRQEGLQVPSGRTLALVGGHISLEGGRLQAPGGRVELAGVTGAGVVGLTQLGQVLQLHVPDQLARANVTLTDNAQANVSAGNGGSIAIHASTLDMTTSSLLAGIAPRLVANGSRAGSIDINATTAIHLESSSITTDVFPQAIGDAGNINITTGSLSVVNGSGLYARTFGAGNAGDIGIQARDAVTFDYALAVNVVMPMAQGQGGNIRITATDLSLKNIAQLAALTQGKGDAGNIEINTSNTIHFDGSDGLFSSAVFSSVGDSSPVGSMAQGQGGDLHIISRSVAVTNGARLVANTYGQGDAGNIVIQAHDFVRFDRNSGAFSGVAPTGIGDGGNISIYSGSLLLANQAQLGVSSAGFGNAGSLTIVADTIKLDYQGKISADTIRGGGNITLRSSLLTLRRHSNITTNATGAATGGNININANFIVSAPNENNDIIANAFLGSGGKITISAQGLFWFNLRTRQELQRLLNTSNPAELDPRRWLTNDITAFSQANPTIDTGSVTIRTPDLDPTQAINALPTEFSDPSQLIAATCPADQGSSFAITGRGGLPEDPRQPLIGQIVWQDDRPGEGDREVGRWGDREEEPSNGGRASIVEAQDWMVDRTGTVILVARQPHTQRLMGFEPLSCAMSKP